jgi:hypothetical protein
MARATAGRRRQSLAFLSEDNGYCGLVGVCDGDGGGVLGEEHGRGQAAAPAVLAHGGGCRVGSRETRRFCGYAQACESNGVKCDEAMMFGVCNGGGMRGECTAAARQR